MCSVAVPLSPLPEGRIILAPCGERRLPGLNAHSGCALSLGLPETWINHPFEILTVFLGVMVDAKEIQLSVTRCFTAS